MQGLLLKDCYTLIKQMKIMLLILLLFACMPGYSMAGFAVFYASMLPVTALAYDERSKWDELAVMMPYSPMSIVLSKYLLGLGSVLAATLVACLAQFVIGTIRHTAIGGEDLLSLLLIACAALILLSLNLPLMFRMGVEKGRIAFLILVCGGVVAAMTLREQLMESLGKMENATTMTLGILLLTLVIMAVSVVVAAAMYRRRKG